MWDKYPEQIKQGDASSIARCISLIENRATGYDELLGNLIVRNIPVFGITGPPGAGKSTLADGLIAAAIKDNKKVAVLCVDPSSPFTNGSLLGDRIRMNKWYKESSVYIRSLSTRGSLGGLNPMIIEITDLLRAADFDFIIIETVGIGQSEIEIAGIADITMVVLVPESGDDIQAMKSGVMEIADVFVINKSDRPDADQFATSLRNNLPPGAVIPVLKTTASTYEGIEELYAVLFKMQDERHVTEKKKWILSNKAYALISHERMKDVDMDDLRKKISVELAANKSFNLYQFIQTYPGGK